LNTTELTGTSAAVDPARDPREPLHQLNGRFLVALQKLIPECHWEEWIVNVIVLHRTVTAVETVTLETSATLWHGEEFFSRDDCEKRGSTSVRSLDGEVPLDDSYAGYCIRERNVVWVDDLTDKTQARQPSRTTEADPLKEKYRSFAYVGVVTKRPARAEYVFPLRLRAGLSDALLGVVNCEWYGGGANPENTFQKLGRTIVSHLLTNLIDVHARFLPLAFDQIQVPVSDWNRFLADYYTPCVLEHISQIRKGDTL